jgi:WD40 repeat protein
MMNKTPRSIWLVVWTVTALAAAALLGPQSAFGQGEPTGPIKIADLKRSEPVAFEKEVLPILNRSCIACHNASKFEGNLVLETPQSIIKGGDSGPAVVPGRSDESLLLLVASHQDEPVMPPPDNKVKARRLNSNELGLIKLWIDQGAKGEVTGRTSIAWQPLPLSVNPVLAVAISADRQFVASGRGNEIHVYGLPQQRLAARLVDPALAPLAGSQRSGVAHLDLVQSLAFSPDGELLASGSYREVKLWRRPREVQLGELSGASQPLRSLALSSDGRWAAGGEQAGPIRLWDLTAGKLARTLSGHSAEVTALQFTPDGQRLVSASQDKTLRVWQTADGASVRQIEAPTPLHALALVREGAQVAAGGDDNVVRIWELAAANDDSAKPAKELAGHTGPVRALASVGDSGQELLSGSQDGSVRHWNVETGQQVRQMSHGAPLTGVAADPTNKRFASTSAAGTLKVWNAENGQQVAEVKGDRYAQFAVERLDRQMALAKARLEDRKQQLKEAEDRHKKEQDALPKAKEAKAAAEKSLKDKQEAAKKPLEALQAAEKELVAVEKEVAEAEAAAAKAAQAAKDKPDDKNLAKAAQEAEKTAQAAKQRLAPIQKKVDDLAKPARAAETEAKNAETLLVAAVRTLEAAEASAKAAAEAIPAAQKRIAEAEQAVQQAEAAAAAAKQAAAGTVQPLLGLAHSAAASRWVTGGESRSVQTWDAATGAALDVFAGHREAVSAVAVDPGGRILAAAGKSVIVWEGEPRWALEAVIGRVDDPDTLVDRVLSLDFSPDSKQLATGGGDPSRTGELKLWEVATGKPIRAVPDAHSDTIFCVRFSPDGEFLATAAADRFMKVFRVADGSLVRGFEGHTHHVLAVGWRGDGKVLATGGADNVIKVWDFISGDQKRTIQGFGKEVTSLVFVGDTPRVLSGCGDKSVRLHNTDSGGNERTFSGCEDFVHAVAVSSDGKLVAAGGEDGLLRLWELQSGQSVQVFAPPREVAADQRASR